MAYKFPLSYDSWDHKEKEAIFEVVKDGFFTMGKKVKKFEEEFSNYIGSKYAIMTNSGSSANLLMIASLVLNKDIDLNAGDEVIVPTLSWATTYSPLQQYKLKARFVDIDIDTLNIEYDFIKIESSFTHSSAGSLNSDNYLDQLLKTILQHLGSLLKEHS